MTQRSQFSFNQAAEPPKRKSKPTAQNKKRPAPLSVRVSNAEREWIKRKAGSQSVNAFVRERIFAEQPQSRAVDNRKDVARLLAALGRSRMAASLRSLAYSADIGALALDDELRNELASALNAVSEIRDAILKALR